MTPQNNAILQCLLYHFKANCTEFDFCLGCTPDSARELTLPPPLPRSTHQLYLRGLFLRGWRKKGRRLPRRGMNGGREGPVKSVKPRARMVAITLLMLGVQRGAGITCKFSITRKRKKGKEKRTETA